MNEFDAIGLAVQTITNNQMKTIWWTNKDGAQSSQTIGMVPTGELPALDQLVYMQVCANRYLERHHSGVSVRIFVTSSTGYIPVLVAQLTMSDERHDSETVLKNARNVLVKELK